MERISWGVLSTAKIGLRKVIPALQKGNYSEVIAIALRDFEKAQQATKKLGIPRLMALMKNCWLMMRLQI